MIRNILPQDDARVCDLLRHFRDASGFVCLQHPDNEPYIRGLLAEIRAGRGIGLVSEREAEVTGLILGVIQPNVWNPDLRVLSELAWWVEPQYRHTTAGYRLLEAYDQQARQLQQQGRVHTTTISKITTSPDIDYSRWGYNKLEETWVR